MKASLALMLATIPVPATAFAQEAQTLPEPVATEFDPAFSTFRTLCVDTLPVPEKFVTAMNGLEVKWVKEAKSPAEVFGVGNSWWSPLGEVTYIHRPGDSIPIANSACHLEFRTMPGFDHAASVSHMSAAYGLKPDKLRREKTETQTCFSGELADGRHARFYLTSHTDFAKGEGARLSMSMIHSSNEKVRKQLMDKGVLDCR